MPYPFFGRPTCISSALARDGFRTRSAVAYVILPDPVTFQPSDRERNKTAYRAKQNKISVTQVYDGAYM